MITRLMGNILSVIKYFLYIIATALVFYGIYMIYDRLDKNIIDYLYVIIPFVLLFIVLVINMFMKNDFLKNNILFNFTACIVFITIIFIALRAQFDLSLVLNIKYSIGYNTTFLSENLNNIIVMIYILLFTNIFMFIYAIIEKYQKKRTIATKIEII